jgi:hypothetical protein
MKTQPIALLANCSCLDGKQALLAICDNRVSAVHWMLHQGNPCDEYHYVTRKPTGKEFDLYLSAGNKVFKR